MRLNISKIKFSRVDIKRGVSLPDELNDAICESYGILLGDGHLSCYRNGRDYILSITLLGLGDTDFSLTFKSFSYPRLHAGFSDESLTSEITFLLNKMNFNCNYYKSKETDKRNNKVYTSYHIFLEGEQKVNSWINKIGFNNSKHLNKYLIWKKFGFCPKYTTNKDRDKILKGLINPYKKYDKWEYQSGQMEAAQEKLRNRLA